MKRVLTSALLTFTLLTQPAYAQFYGGGGGGYQMPGMNYQGAGYYPAMQGCPYNQGAMPGSYSRQDDQASADQMQAQIDAIQKQIDLLTDGGDSDYGQKASIHGLEESLRSELPPSLFDLAITDHMENMGDCSCMQTGTEYDQTAPGQGPHGDHHGRPGHTDSFNDQSPAPGAGTAVACLQFDTPDFKGEFPAAFYTVDNSWDVPVDTSKLPPLKLIATSVASNKGTGQERMPAQAAPTGTTATTPTTPVKPVVKKKHHKKKKSSGNGPDPQQSSGNGPDPQAPVAPAPVADQPATPPPPPPPAPPQAPVQAAQCSAVPQAPPQTSCPGTGHWYPNGVCKDHGRLDPKICSNEFRDSMKNADDSQHRSSSEITKCKNDLSDLYRMLERRKTLQARIDAIQKKQWDEETGLADGDRHGGGRGGMESSAGGRDTSIDKWGLALGAGLSLLGGAGGLFGGLAANKDACTMNAKLGYPCNGNNWGAVQAGISGLGVGVPVMTASLYSAAMSGTSGSCGGQATPYGMQPTYGMGGMPGQSGAFGYPQGYGPISPFGQQGFGQGIGAGALMPGMGYMSQGMANPYGSPFGASQYGGFGGAYGGAGALPFGGYGQQGGFGANAGFSSGAISPYGLGGYAGYNPMAAQNELGYRLGVESPMGYASNMQSAQALLGNALTGVSQINSGYGGYGYGAYGAGTPYGYGYGGGSPGLSIGIGANYSSGYSPYSSYNPYSLYGSSYPNYNLGYGSSFNSLSPSAAITAFGTTSTSSSATPFGR